MPICGTQIRVALGGGNIEKNWALNELVVLMKEMHSNNQPQQAKGIAKFLAVLVDLEDQTDLASQIRMKVALSTAFRGQPLESGELSDYQKLIEPALKKTRSAVRYHPNAKDMAWDPKIPYSKHVIRGQKNIRHSQNTCCGDKKTDTL